MSAEAIVPAAEDWRRQYEEYHVSPAVRVGDHVYCCGVTGWDRDTGGYAEDPATQFDQALGNVSEILAAAGASWSDVVKAVSYHVGELHEHIPGFVAARNRYVSEPYPAWSAAVVAGLPHPAALVQVEVTAVLSPGA